MAGVAPTPRNEQVGRLADALTGVRSWLNALGQKSFPVRSETFDFSIPVPSGIGDFLLAKAPEEVNEWSYGNLPFKERPSHISALPQIRESRVPQVVDALGIAPISGAMKAPGLFGLAMKPRGGAWLPKTIEEFAKPLAKGPITETAAELAVRKQAAERMAKSYLQRHAGTAEDPLKDIHWEGWGEGLPTWEQLSDVAFVGQKPSEWVPLGRGPEFAEGSFLGEALRRAPEEPIYGFKQAPPGQANYRSARLDPYASSMAARQRMFDFLSHVSDVTREVPAEELGRWDLIRAVRETQRRDAELAKRMGKFSLELRKSAQSVAEYPDASRWVRLNRAGEFADESDAMGHSVRGYEPPPGHPDHVKGAKGGQATYGGGGWEAIKNDRARVYSLRDSDGRSLATIEMLPDLNRTALRQSMKERLQDLEYDMLYGKRSFGSKDIEDFRDAMKEIPELDMESVDDFAKRYRSLFDDVGFEPKFETSGAWTVTQIKGVKNAKPSPEAIPKVQSFLRELIEKENVGYVDDIGNADAWQLVGGGNGLRPVILTRDEATKMAIERGYDPKALAANPQLLDAFIAEHYYNLHMGQ